MKTNVRAGMIVAAAGLVLLAACGGDHEEAPAAPVASVPQGVEFTVTAAPRVAYLNAAGVVRPIADATLSTKLMGSVTEVMVQEGDAVRQGQPLLRIDARDLGAQRQQVEAGQANAEAVLAEAELHVKRMRALFEDDAAPRAQLDAAETGYTRALAGVAAARASAAELAAVSSYAVIRAPFNGTVVRRMVDPGSFAAPGAPLLTVQDARRLRVTVSASPDAVRGVRAGEPVTAVVEGIVVPATIEGVVPGAAGLFSVNALIDNADGRLPGTGAAELALPQGMRTTMVVPVRALRRQGDLTGVYLVRGEGVLTRWVRLGPVTGDSVEVVSGLQDGDRIIVPTAVPGAPADADAAILENAAGVAPAAEVMPVDTATSARTER